MKTSSTTVTSTIAAIAFFIISPESQGEENLKLSERHRAIIPIAALTGSGMIPKLEGALAEGLEAGLSVNEITEVLVHAYAYAGFPRALNGINAFMTVLAKRKEQGMVDVMGKEATPMPTDFDRNSYGHQIRNTLVGSDVSKRTSGYPIFAPVIERFLVEHLFADIFYRDLLNHQDREFVTVSILAALSGTESQLKTHLQICMNVGVSKAVLEDFVDVLRQNVSVESAERAAAALYALHGSSVPLSRGQSLQVVKNAEPTKGVPEHFTGSVTVESPFASKGSNSYRGAVVNFEAGARTAWHTHPLGQTLLVISGRGLVQSEGQDAQKIFPGDVVWIPARTRHWHGAAADSPLSHVAISTPLDDSTVEWMELVTDEQYGK